MRISFGLSALGRSASNQSAGILLGARGSITALVTPFHDGQVDAAALADLCERQIRRGTTALIVCGSTGEASALAPAEHARVVSAAVEAASYRVPVIAGCGAPATEAAADETVARLYDSGLAVAVKDATGDLSRPARLRALCGAGLIQFTGDDATAAAHRAMGGHGCMSVAANLAPALCAGMHAAWDHADLAEFARLRDLLAPLHQALFRESNPIPIKAALCMAGLCDGTLRLPLTRASSATLDALGVLLPELIRAEDEAARLPRLTLMT